MLVKIPWLLVLVVVAAVFTEDVRVDVDDGDSV